MEKKQEQAATQLLRAFRACHQVGLSVAIYDCRVCVWPKGNDVLAANNPIDRVDDIGRSFAIAGMYLDGGAGN